jgi:hypothetical protein
MLPSSIKPTTYRSIHSIANAPPNTEFVIAIYANLRRLSTLNRVIRINWMHPSKTMLNDQISR